MKNIIITFLLLISFNLFGQMPTNQVEKDGILWLSESTKLSKDIYYEIHRLWNVNIFKSIEYLENNDMKAVAEILKDYNISNPNKDTTLGIYTSPYISNLFTDFSGKYDNSEYEALRIAATLEDLMISDLNELLQSSTNTDFIKIFTELRYSAISHIRAVNKYMKKKYKVEYQAQFLSPVELKEILLN